MMAGYTVLELMLVGSLAITLSAVAIPNVVSGLESARTAAAARYLAGRLHLARLEAVKRSAAVAVRFEGPEQGYRFALFTDGNGDGVRARDIARGADHRLSADERLSEQFPSVRFGFIEGARTIDSGTTVAPEDDPIQIGRSAFLTFSPNGTATAGTLYLRGRGAHQFAVRVLGVTGRIRVLEFNRQAGQWISR